MIGNPDINLLKLIISITKDDELVDFIVNSSAVFSIPSISKDIYFVPHNNNYIRGIGLYNIAGTRSLGFILCASKVKSNFMLKIFNSDGIVYEVVNHKWFHTTNFDKQKLELTKDNFFNHILENEVYFTLEEHKEILTILQDNTYKIELYFRGN